MKKILAAAAIAVGLLGTSATVALAEPLPPIPAACHTEAEIVGLQADVDAAAGDLTKANADHTAALAALTDANADLEGKRTALTNAQGELVTARDTLEKATTAYNDDPSDENKAALDQAAADETDAANAERDAATAETDSAGKQGTAAADESAAAGRVKDAEGAKATADAALQAAQDLPVCVPSKPVSYENCTDVWNRLGHSLLKDEPGYEPKLDRDGDGVACEKDPRGETPPPTGDVTPPADSDTPAPPTSDSNVVVVGGATTPQTPVKLASNDTQQDLAYTGTSSSLPLVGGIGALLLALGALGLIVARKRHQA